MPRFSAEAKEFHDAIWYYQDTAKAKSLMKELNDPLDNAFADLFFAGYYILFQQQEKFLQILADKDNENKRLNDQFIQFIINNYYCRYYLGHNNPIVSKKQTKKYLGHIEQSYQDIEYRDDWEKYYCIGWYYHTKALCEVSINGDHLTAIKFQKKCVETWSNIPEDGEYYSSYGHNNLGLYHQFSGNFEEAEKSFNRVLDEYVKYNNLYQLWPLDNLSDLCLIKGELQKAKAFNMRGLDIAKRYNNTSGIFGCLTRIGSHHYQEGNYDEALKSYQESLVYRKQHGDLLPIFWGHYRIFNFYYQRFKMTKDKAFFSLAEQTLDDLQELRNANPENKIVVNYTDYAHSLILKHGNIRKKGQAIEIMERLIELYPRDIDISLNLMEVLFGDVIESEDNETINQIDELMVKISSIPLRNNRQAIFDFISKHIVLAKYSYYIKGDPSAALDILNDAKDRITTFKLHNLVNELEAEIQILEGETPKWDNLDMPIKDRIQKSEFTKYIQEAINRSFELISRQQYQLVHLDLLKNQPEIQKQTCRVGIAQIGLSSVNDLLTEFYEELAPGFFTLKMDKVEPSRSKIKNIIEEAHLQGINILLFPELTVDLNHDKILADLTHLSKKYQMYIVPGSYHDKETTGNLSIVIGPDGILWKQEKHIPATIHFDGKRFQEGIDVSIKPRRMIICNTEYGRVAIVICRDFLDMDLRVALKNVEPPVDIILNPAFTPVTADFQAAHFDARRSIYAYCYFANVAEFGNSMIFTPEKDRNEYIIPPKEESIIYKDIDIFKLRSERKKWEIEQKKERAFIQSTRN
ncbi:MAG: tetratricopeptide repeat protein [Candidatus Kariarchaeaceae archaeon]|jgi:predicted amidohydrolase/tetratricopeptide (TPR) repeat protein